MFIMTKSTIGYLGVSVMIGYCAFEIAQHIANSTKQEARAKIESTEVSRGASAPTESDRKIEAVGVVTLELSRRTDLLTEIAAPRPPSLQEAVESQIAESGPRATAESVRDDLVLLPAEKLARIEEVTRRWALANPVEVREWIEDQLESGDPSGAFEQAALSGYLESIALIDPEAAAGTADLLDSATVEPDTGDGQVSTAAPTSADPGFPGDRGFLTRNRK